VDECEPFFNGFLLKEYLSMREKKFSFLFNKTTFYIYFIYLEFMRSLHWVEVIFMLLDNDV
jgi:hypothetical protein